MANETYYFRRSGKLVYSEPCNPYETVEIYLDQEEEGIVVKSYISEHGPDGISSWHGIFLDGENTQKLTLLSGGNIEVFLRFFLREHAQTGLIALSDFLDEHKIIYTQKWAF